MRWIVGKFWQQLCRRAWNVNQFGQWIEREVGPFIAHAARKIENFAADKYDSVYYRPVVLKRRQS